MKIFLLLVLGTAIAIALPQNDQRRRGLRRFSLASPGLKASAREEVAQDVAEEPAGEVDTPQKTRGRGSSLLRRRRPSGRRIPSVESEPVQEQVEEKVVEVPPPRNTGGRGSIRLRRPLRKPTKPTTTTTTTTSAPVTEDVMLNSEDLGEIPVDEVLPKEAVEDKTDAKEMPGSEVKKDTPDVKIAKPTKPLSPKVKLRPIPIKSARKQAQKETPEESATMSKDETPSDQETTSSISEPVSSHRFSSRRKTPRIQSRRRQSQPVTPHPVQEEKQTQTGADPVEAPAKQRLRGRGSGLRRPALRQSSRGKTAITNEETAPEAPEETLGVEEAPSGKPTTITRFPNIKEHNSAIKIEETERIPKSKKESKVFRPKFRRPKTTPEIPEITTIPTGVVLGGPATPERTTFELEPELHSARVNKERPRGSKQPKLEVQAEVKPKFPTPNYGGSDLLIRGGEVQITQIGTVEDSPVEEVRMILSGLGSRRRGLARPKQSQNSKAATKPKEIDSQIAASVNEETPVDDVDYLYEYYDYLYDEVQV